MIKTLPYEIKNDTYNTKYISSGELDIARNGETLVSTPLGSCIAFIIYDVQQHVGGLAHIMLPGRPFNGQKQHLNKYACFAIENLLNGLYPKGFKDQKPGVCLVGGANVLRKENDSLTIPLILQVLEIIKEKKLILHAASLGGYERRSAQLNTKTGTVYYTIGNKPPQLLWNYLSEENSLYKTGI